VDDRESLQAIDPAAVADELQRVRNFIRQAETLPRDSKAEKLLDAMRVIAERPGERHRVVIFTESLVTQDYLRRLLIERGGFGLEDITLFRGTNDSRRSTQALERWQAEVGDALPSYQRPSRTVAIRIALVHEFKTRSRIFISTEAGAKGLNLQFCDTIINYDLPWNPQRIEQRIGRCHRYGQEHDVTVINFLASDNEAQRLTFEILSRKLDLFGKVLDASDVVLHEPSVDAPEKLAGVLGSDFETKLRRIYERARSIDEITAELRHLREEMDEERLRFEQTWARTAGLIETRFDQRVKQVFRRLKADLPRGLARLDEEMDELVSGYLNARGIPYRRTPGDGHVRFDVPPSQLLPEGLTVGAAVVAGKTNELEDGDSLHLGHPLVEAAVREARTATGQPFRVAWKIGKDAPSRLKSLKGKRGRLILSRVRYSGFERVDRLIPTALIEGDATALEADCARWLLEQQPRDRAFGSPVEVGGLDDAIEELVFLDQVEAPDYEQQRFERTLEQIERSVDDRLLVLRRRLTAETKALRQAEERRDTALGSEARDHAERRMQAIQKEIDSLEAEIGRLEKRDDAEYQRWREQAHERRYRPPEITRVLDVEFILE
jgi:hypothetical protein